MKAWKEYTKSEKGMIITILVLLAVVLLSLGRVTDGAKKGINLFFGSKPEESAQVR